MTDFRIQADYSLTGDQPEAVAALAEGVRRGDRYQTLLGVTGSGKTFTMANVIEKAQKPTLVIAHNKTLAAQLCNEFREFLPDNAVEYFVSYYDYYQPEAYVPAQDLYIEKDSSINDEIDRLRHSATTSLFLRRDVVIVASVSCIYGLGLARGLPREDGAAQRRRPGRPRRDAAQAGRHPVRAQRLRARARQVPRARRLAWRSGRPRRTPPSACSSGATRSSSSSSFDPVGGEVIEQAAARRHLSGHALRHRQPGSRARPASRSSASWTSAAPGSRSNGKILEAHRLRQRTLYDMEMLREMGFCNGIENYSRILLGKQPGATPNCLLDYFPDDFLCFIDESHMTLPQIRGMYEGDKSRKTTLVDYGFRLPSALDNRPLRIDEFLDEGAADRLRQRHAGPVRARQQRQHRRADHPAHRPGRPRGRGAAHRRADRRPHERDPPPRRQGRARARHHAHQAHVRGPHRLPARERLQGALPAQRGRHARAHPDRARPAPG